MKKFFSVSVLVLCAGIRVGLSQTATTEVDFFNGAATLLRDQNGIALTQGTAAINNDGALIQLGYFSMGTTASNFAGTWIPITGFGTTLPRTTIGDSSDNTGAGDGRLAFTTVFRDTSNLVQVFDPGAGDTGTYVSQSSITITTTTPPSGQVLAIRFYNTNTGTSGFYNTVSSDNWLWSPPTDAGTNVLLNLVSAGAAGTLEFESGPTFGVGSNFMTVIAIPEPSTFALVGLGAVALGAGYRRRVRMTA